jgi:predicted amidohydrolase YtcJ
VLPVVLMLLACAGSPEDRSPEVRVFLARKVITMEPGDEASDAVAVEGGRIVAVGRRDAVQEALAGRRFVLDSTFADKVVMPGFIDPHLHPWIVSAILPLEIVSALEWETPRGRSEAVRGREAFLAKLGERSAALPAEQWLVAWGYHEPYHGKISRSDLDGVSRERPVVVWQRSIHEFFFNTRALEALGLTEDDFAKTPHGNWEEGHLYETGLFVAEAMIARLLEPATFARGLEMMSQVLHRGGITTIGDQGFPAMNLTLELAAMRHELAKDVPYRYVIVPNGMTLSRARGSVAGGLAAATELLDVGSERIRVVRHVKYLADGAMFSQLMQMRDPYLDGHEGAWLMEPAEQAAVLDAFWRAGWDVHIHVNGDAGLDAVLDLIEAQRKAQPRDDVRVVLEHYGYAREDQHARVKALGVVVSSNPYYLHELAPPYANHGLGPARASNLAPLGGLVRAGVPFSLHSDAYMAPAEPLTLAWVAANRIASDGRVWGESQRVPLDLALRAITREAAFSLGLEDEIGSIAPGKRADFTVLERDPYEVPIGELHRIPIWGTVFEGRLYPID